MDTRTCKKEDQAEDMPADRIINGRKAFLMRIRPKDIRTQVNVGERGSRGFRSLLLLGLLLVVALLALLTLSQMALMEHQVLDYLGPGRLRPSLGGRSNRGHSLHRLLGAEQRPQFKIEPLLNREAPTLELNCARTVHGRVSRYIAALIIEESLSVLGDDNQRGRGEAYDKQQRDQKEHPPEHRLKEQSKQEVISGKRTQLGRRHRAEGHEDYGYAGYTHEGDNNEITSDTKKNEIKIKFKNRMHYSDSFKKENNRKLYVSAKGKTIDKNNKADIYTETDRIQHKMEQMIDTKVNSKNLLDRRKVKKSLKTTQGSKTNCIYHYMGEGKNITICDNSSLSFLGRYNKTKKGDRLLRSDKSSLVKRNHNNINALHHITDAAAGKHDNTFQTHVQKSNSNEQDVVFGTGISHSQTKPENEEYSEALQNMKAQNLEHQADAYWTDGLPLGKNTFERSESDSTTTTEETLSPRENVDLDMVYQEFLSYTVKGEEYEPLHLLEKYFHKLHKLESNGVASVDTFIQNQDAYLNSNISAVGHQLKEPVDNGSLAGTHSEYSSGQHLLGEGLEEVVDRHDDKTWDTIRREEQQLEDELYRRLPLCPEIPPGLRGNEPLNVPRLEEIGIPGLLSNLSWVREGGSWSPIFSPTSPCRPRHRVAVVVPYRDRVQHLALMLNRLHPLLRRQQLQYTVYVAEQVGNVTFNKGAIMNAGFSEIFLHTDAQCFVFHDVDLLAEDDRNMYSCPSRPRHLSVGVDTLQYKLPYFLLVGGVLVVTGEQFLRANGYSNMYWGWGGEDDDMGYRLMQSGLGISRPPYHIARYSMIRHTKRKPLVWKVRGKLVRTSSKRYRLDGLNTLEYLRVGRGTHPLYTHLLLDVGTPPSDFINLSQQ